MCLERDSELLPVGVVVRPAGELDEAAAVVADAVAGVRVAEVRPPFVHLLEVGRAAVFVDRLEIRNLGPDGGERRDRACPVAESFRGERGLERWPEATHTLDLAAEQRGDLPGVRPLPRRGRTARPGERR